MSISMTPEDRALIEAAAKAAGVSVLAGRLGAAVIMSDSGDIAKLDPALPVLKV